MVAVAAIIIIIIINHNLYELSSLFKCKQIKFHEKISEAFRMAPGDLFSVMMLVSQSIKQSIGEGIGHHPLQTDL